MSAVALAQPGQGQSPPASTSSITRPNHSSLWSRDADIACVGTALEDTFYACGISCRFQQTWTVKNSTHGTAVNNAWGCTVAHPESGWTVGIKTARCELSPPVGGLIIGDEFDITP